MSKAAIKRCLFWCPFAGFIGYFFSAEAAMPNWPLIMLSVCVMMFEAGYVVLLIDQRSRRSRLTILGVVAGGACIATLIATGVSVVSLLLFSATALLLLPLWLSVKKLERSIGAE